MATQVEKLAQALDALNAVSGGSGVVRSSDIGATHRKRLIRAGFLEEVIKEWLIVTNPAAPQGASASWYGSFWEFVSKYLDSRFGNEYCLSAEASIKVHVDSTLIPAQVSVIVRQSTVQTVKLKFDTSIFIYYTKAGLPSERSKIGGMWVMDISTAICKLSPTFYKTNSTDAEIALRLIREPSSLLRVLLDGGNVVVAGRLVGAYKFLGQPKIAEQIKKSMEAAGNTIRVANPFDYDEPSLKGHSRITSPHVARIQGLWSRMRTHVLEAFREIEPRQIAAEAYLMEIEERYVTDAYNSLSIEGYKVTPDLIERVRSNDWNPNASDADKREQNALAARGYYQTFQAVKRSIERILGGEDSAAIIARYYQSWYREMFSPAVQAGQLQAHLLAGYRNNAVFLRGSRHVPPGAEAIVDCMEAYVELLKTEPAPIVRAVLGHYIFVYIHPYPDGNGRIGRFIMNAALASGGYPWTIITQAHRDMYLAALEEATTSQNLHPFAEFVLQEMQAPLDKQG